MLSVLFLSCKRLAYLKETLASIRDHLAKVEPRIPARFICVDNGSTPEDREELARLGFDTLVLLRENLGIGPAMNHLVAAVRSPYFLNLQDDWIVDNPFSVPFIQESIAILEHDFNVIQVKLDAMHFMDFSDRQRYSEPQRAPGGNAEYFVTNPKVPWGGWTFPPAISRTACMHELGPFLETNPLGRGWAESEYSARSTKKYVTVKSPHLLIFEHIGDRACEGWGASKSAPTDASPATASVAEISHKARRWVEEAQKSGYSAPNDSSWEIAKRRLQPFEGDASSPVAFFGPWVGEFGWEICRWQAGVRRIASQLPSGTRIVVCGDLGHHPLYEYAHEYWSVPHAMHAPELARETFRLLPKHLAHPYTTMLRGAIARDLQAISEQVQIVEPRKFAPEEQDFIHPAPTEAGTVLRSEILRKCGISKWICAFPRQRGFNPQKNWPLENWSRLAKAVTKVFDCGFVVLGREEDTARLDGQNSKVVNLLDLPPDQRMEAAIAFLAGAQASIGSECGGPFLSLLCGCPAFVMGGTVYEKRYVEEENPMRTPCAFLAKEGYRHSYKEVTDEVMRFLSPLMRVSRTSPPHLPKPAGIPVASPLQPSTARTNAFSRQVAESLSAPTFRSVRPAPLDTRNTAGALGTNPLESALHKSSTQSSRPFKILFAGVFDDRSTNTSQARALERQGCQVVSYPYRERAQAIGQEKRDRELVSLCEREAPDLMLFSKCNGMAPWVAEECTKICPTAVWFMDWMGNFDEDLAAKIRACTFTCCARRGPFLEACRLAERVYFLQEGFDPESNFPVSIPQVHPVSFIGHIHAERTEYHRRFKFHVFGDAFGRGHSEAVCSSKINLNFTDNGDGTSDRTYKVLASGGFLLTQPWKGMEIDFSPGNDVEVFTDPNDLARKVSFYLENDAERNRIARNGQIAVQRFSRDEWARQIVTMARSNARGSAPLAHRVGTRGRNQALRRGFSIVIPTWNNLPYLKKALDSIRRFSEFNHEVVLHINEGSDGTLEWVREQGLKHTHSETNAGVCVGVNRATELATRDYVMYFNDDMVALPLWDSALVEWAERHSLGELAWLSSTLIEPTGFNRDFIAPANYGTDLDSFDEEALLLDLPGLRFKKSETFGTTWAPCLLHRNTFDRMGRFSEAFSPGFGSDPDLAKKLWDLGGRQFIGVGGSLVYHFQCKCTDRLAKSGLKNDGHAVFRRIHGMGIPDFVNGIFKKEAWRPASNA